MPKTDDYSHVFNVTIQGKKPGYLMNQFDPESLMESDAKKKGKQSRFDITDWRGKIYKDQDENVYIPANHIEQAMFEACKRWNRKSPRKWYQGNLIIEPDEIIFEDVELEDFYEAEEIEQVGLGNSLVRRVNGCGLLISQVGKGPPITVRPTVLSPWEVSFKVCLDEDKYGAEMTREVLSAAGRYPGIGAWRPENKGKFGRFKIIEFN